jgi:hypothetical protein
MQSEPSLFKKQYRFVVAGLLAMAAAQPVVADNTANDTYTWSAELVSTDQQARTATVQARFVNNPDVDFDALEPGDRVTLVWSGINIAAGVRRITDGAAQAEDRLTLPIEFVSTEIDDQYVRFKVPIPADDLAKVASLSAGQWITGTSPHRAANWEEAVVNLRLYTDVD